MWRPIAFGLLCCLSLQAHASYVYQLNGVFTSVVSEDAPFTAFAAGDVFHMTVTYTPPTSTEGRCRGAPVFDISLEVKNSTIGGDRPFGACRIGVSEEDPFGTPIITGVGLGGGDLSWWMTNQWFLYPNLHGEWPVEIDPDWLVGLTFSTYSRYVIGTTPEGYNDINVVALYGRVIDLVSVSVPEPSPLVLLTLGLAAVGWFRRCTRNSSYEGFPA